MDYLTKPSFFEDFGFVQKVKMADRVKPEDEAFLVAYPYFNVNGNSRFNISFQLSCIKISLFHISSSFKCALCNFCNAEMLVVEELYKEAVVSTPRKLIIFNGELDRIRSGCILV